MTGVGSDVWSALHNDLDGYGRWSGTSMATPGVAGLFAIAASQQTNIVGSSKFDLSDAQKVIKGVMCQAVDSINGLPGIPLGQTTCLTASANAFPTSCSAYPNLFACTDDESCPGDDECKVIDATRGRYYGTTCGDAGTDAPMEPPGFVFPGCFCLGADSTWLSDGYCDECLNTEKVSERSERNAASAATQAKCR